MATVAAGLVVFRALSNASALASAQVQFLLMHASYEENLWTPPKGHLEPGENLRQCAIRETDEESGLREGVDIKILPHWTQTINYLASGKPKSVTFYLAKLVNAEAQVRLSDEHRDFAWCDIGRAVDLARYKETVAILQSAHDFILSGSGEKSEKSDL